MNNTSLSTTCLFRGAYFMCNGCRIVKIIFLNGNQTATFLIEGDNIDKLDTDYINGKAQVNPILFKENLNRLRDNLTETLNQRRLRNDRKGDHRIHKNKYRSENLHRVQGYRV